MVRNRQHRIFDTVTKVLYDVAAESGAPTEEAAAPVLKETEAEASVEAPEEPTAPAVAIEEEPAVEDKHENGAAQAEAKPAAECECSRLIRPDVLSHHPHYREPADVAHIPDGVPSPPYA